MNSAHSMNRERHRFFSYIFSSPLRAFILLAVVFGTLTISIAPPLTGADEEAHFVRAYGISKGDFRLFDARAVNMPKSFRQTIGCFQTKTNEPGFMYRYDYSNYGINKKQSFNCAFSLPLDGNDTELLPTTAQFYSPTTYIPQVTAILIGRTFNMPIAAIVYLVRLFILAAYVFMIALAIKLLPIRKWAMAGIALLPTCIGALTNPGGDYMLFGSISILMAIIIRSIYLPRHQFHRENNYLTIGLLVAATLAVLPKGLFPGVCILPIIVFYGGFRYQKKRKALIIIATLVVGLCWQKFGINTNLVTMNQGINSPLHFPNAFFQTMLTRWVDTDFIYIGDGVGNIPVTGNRLGLPSLVITIINMLVGVYLFVSYPEKSKPQVSKKQMTALIYTSTVCSIAIVIGSFAALYVGGSYLQTIGDPIRGVQTRYFFPALFLLAAIPLSHKLFIESEKLISKIVVYGSVVCLSSMALVSIVTHHWWNPF